MKKGFAIILLTLMFFSQIGYQAMYLIQQLIIREEQKELAFSMLPESSLETIKDNDQIDWEEEGKEFYLNGNMYDVVKTKFIQGEKIFYVVNDERESEVLKKFENTIRIQHQQDQNRKGGGLELKFHKTVFTVDVSIESLVHDDENKAYKIFDDTKRIRFFAEILIPPPQC